MRSDVQAGAAAFLRLLREVDDAGSRAFDEIDGDVGIDDGDPRDYRAMATMVEASLRQDVALAGPAHREGFVRAMTHLLSLCSEGFGVNADWDPLTATEAAFCAPMAAAAALRRARAVD